MIGVTPEQFMEKIDRLEKQLQEKNAQLEHLAKALLDADEMSEGDNSFKAIDLANDILKEGRNG